jgi:small subunit ribosomal protein S20
VLRVCCIYQRRRIIADSFLDGPLPTKDGLRIAGLGCLYRATQLAIARFSGFSYMANTAQARKRARQAVKQNAQNASMRSRLRTAIKAVRKAIDAGDKAAAQTVFQNAQRIIDSIADKNIVHKNKAARHKSRLAAAVKALAV